MKKRSFPVIAAIIISCVMLSGCGSSGKLSEGAADNSAAYDTGGVYAATTDNAAAEEVPVLNEAESAGTGTELLEENAQAAERKLIRTVDLSVETEEYDALLANLERRIAGLGGYIEYQNQHNGSYYSGYQDTRDAYMKIRIPARHLDEFIENVGEWTNIRDKEERVEDVTLRYVDLESRKRALTTEQDRLLELLEKAESVEDIISIEERLSNVRYELESMESQLRTLNNQIDYSAINLNIQEVRRLTPTEEKTVWDKMRNGFVKTIYNIGDEIESGFVWFVVNIPYFVIWAALIVIALIVWRIWKKARRRRKAENMQPKPNMDEMIAGNKGDNKDGE